MEMQSATGNRQLAILGMAWVTPLGLDLEEVWSRLKRGERAPVSEMISPRAPRAQHGIPVPPKLAEAASRNTRLRRSSAISLFTVTAGLAALENAGIAMSAQIAERTAVVFAVASGGVIYTRKFYERIALEGADCASPLLFPETVYNAPASHLAALLGITGASYTLVGDQSVGISALKLAEQLLASQSLDRVIVVGGEEVDWILCEAYRSWRLSKTPLAEGAAALVLARSSAENPLALRAIHEGIPFFSQRQARAAMEKMCGDISAQGPVDLVVSGANGSFTDAAESHAVAKFFPSAKIFRPKISLGEAIGAGALIQTICAALAIKHGEANAALIPVCGFNHQASGAIVARSRYSR